LSCTTTATTTATTASVVVAVVSIVILRRWPLQQGERIELRERQPCRLRNRVARRLLRVLLLDSFHVDV
jgi:hypothetical protein